MIGGTGCGFCCGWLFGLGTGVTFISVGVLMLVPAGPFQTRNLEGGIALVVLGGTGVASLAGLVVGSAVGGMLGIGCGATVGACIEAV